MHVEKTWRRTAEAEGAIMHLWNQPGVPEGVGLKYSGKEEVEMVGCQISIGDLTLIENEYVIG